MRKLSTVLALFLVIGLSAVPGRAQISNLNEPGSLLVFPLIDNINGVTIVSISNLASSAVTLECLMVTHPEGNSETFAKDDFDIELTAKEAFVWNTALPYSTSIQAFNKEKGFLFCFAVNDAGNAKTHNSLIGDAKVLNLPEAYAWGYSAIPHQRLVRPDGDRTLGLDGAEYTKAASRVYFSGLAALPPALDGVFVAANLDIDLNVVGGQPPVVLNFECWNENEINFSRHTVDPLQTFEQYMLSGEPLLDITVPNIGNVLGFHCAATASSADGREPVWAVFGQYLLFYGWGGNVWQDPLSGASVSITLSDIP